MYKSLQAGRAVAAIMVVLFHIGAVMSLDKYFGKAWLARPFSFGDAGVEFFFVLSGFIIFTAHKQDIFNTDKLLIYLKKRAIRIYPIYWCIFIAIYLVAFATPSLKSSVPHDFGILLKSLLLVPQDKNIVGGTGAPVLIVAWSLQYEIFFYFIFGILFLNRLLSIIFTFCIFSSIVVFSQINSSFPIDFLTSPYVSLFLMGILGAYVTSNYKLTNRSAYFGLLLGFLFFSIISFDVIFQANYFSNFKIVFYGAACTVITVTLVQLERNGLIIGNQAIFQNVGNASYALYLLHFPIISLLCKILIYFKTPNIGFVGEVLSFILIFCISIFCSLIFHKKIEVPMMRALKRLLF